MKSFDPCVIALAGLIASGKTSIALALVKRTGWKFAAFGNYLRNEAHRRGMDAGQRETLQNLGSELIAQGWVNFCSSVLNEAGWRNGEGLIIDGIRHFEALANILSIVKPLRVELVFVETDEEIRRERYLEKCEDTSSLVSIERHISEKQVKGNLREKASLIIDGGMEPKINVDLILMYISSSNRRCL